MATLTHGPGRGPDNQKHQVVEKQHDEAETNLGAVPGLIQFIEEATQLTQACLSKHNG